VSGKIPEDLEVFCDPIGSLWFHRLLSVDEQIQEREPQTLTARLFKPRGRADASLNRNCKDGAQLLESADTSVWSTVTCGVMCYEASKDRESESS